MGEWEQSLGRPREVSTLFPLSVIHYLYMEFRCKNTYKKQMSTDVQNRLLDSVGEGEGGMF